METLNVEDCRPEILAFAVEMERRLRLKDTERGTGNWREADPRDLLRHLESEVNELRREINRQIEPEFRDRTVRDGPLAHHGRFSRRHPSEQDQEQISTGRGLLRVDDEFQLARTKAEAADVANLAMMVADAAVGLVARASVRIFGRAA